MIDLHMASHTSFPSPGFAGNQQAAPSSPRHGRLVCPPHGSCLRRTACHARPGAAAKIAIGTEYLGAGQLSADGVRDINPELRMPRGMGDALFDPQPPKAPDVSTGDWQPASANIFTASANPIRSPKEQLWLHRRDERTGSTRVCQRDGVVLAPQQPILAKRIGPAGWKAHRTTVL